MALEKDLLHAKKVLQQFTGKNHDDALRASVQIHVRALNGSDAISQAEAHLQELAKQYGVTDWGHLVVSMRNDPNGLNLTELELARLAARSQRVKL